MSDIAQRLGQIADGYERDHHDDGAAHWFRAAKDEIERLRALNERLVDAAAQFADDLDALVGESEGIAGLHLNGDVAPWDEVLPGGRYETWLGSLDELDAAIRAVREGQSTAARQEPSHG